MPVGTARDWGAGKDRVTSRERADQIGSTRKAGSGSDVRAWRASWIKTS
jgi:hypothetical protein